MARTTGQDKVRELQRTLTGGQGRSRTRFHSLYDKVFRRDVLERAWESVRANRGAAGVDRATIHDIERDGVSRLLDELAADLRDGKLPSACLRAGFHPEAWSAGAATVVDPRGRDRIVQAALKTVIEPIFEADFMPCSFGFRPGRRAHDALQVLIDQPGTAGGGWWRRTSLIVLKRFRMSG